MDDLQSEVYHLDLTIDFGDLIEKEIGGHELVIVTRIMMQQPMNIEALISVHQKSG